MRILLALAPLALLAACNRPPPIILNEVEPDAGMDNLAGEMNFSLGSAPDYMRAEDMQPRAIAALRPLIPDAETARYQGLRIGRLESICGSVARGRAAARPFVVQPDGTGRIARGERVDLSDISDPFVDLYVRYCASIDELSAPMSNQALPADPDPPAAPEPSSGPPARPDRWNGPDVQRVAPSGGEPNSFREAVRPPTR